MILKDVFERIVIVSILGLLILTLSLGGASMKTKGLTTFSHELFSVSNTNTSNITAGRDLLSNVSDVNERIKERMALAADLGDNRTKQVTVVDTGQPAPSGNLTSALPTAISPLLPLPTEKNFLTQADSCGAGTYQYATESGGVRWRTFPVTYAIDASKSGISTTAAKNAVINAFNTYDSLFPGQLFLLTSDFTHAKIKVQWKYIDGAFNRIGYTTYSYSLSNKALQSATITLDSADKWFISSVQRCSGFGSAFDIQNLATHEVGHAVGLGHVTDKLQTMYPTSYAGETLKRSLGNGDKTGFNYLY
jgi:predicted Zn-dependent protease